MIADRFFREPATGDEAEWFADMSDEENRVEGAPWQAFLQVSGGCFPLGGIWFQTKDDCESFIIREVLNRPTLKR